MQLGLVLSLVSSFQIFQQSVINELQDVDRSSALFSLASASFPLGQFISTLFLACHPISARQGLIHDAWLLIIGGIVSAIPSWLMLCVGRFLIGCGAGLGFVCSTIVLYEAIPYAARPAHYLILGIAFAFATLMINLAPLVSLYDTATLLISSGITVASGIIYILTQKYFGEESPGSLTEEDPPDVSSKYPLTLIYILMALNVSIGVPAILAFSKGVFQNFGLDETASALLSVAFPTAQIMIIIVLHKCVLNRKVLIVGGYIVAVMIQGMLLLTSFYTLLPPEVVNSAMSSNIFNKLNAIYGFTLYGLPMKNFYVLLYKVWATL